MHNLFPTVGEVNGDRSNFVFGEIDGEERKYGECDFEVAERIAEPNKSIRGDIARSYFYMSHQYKMEIPDNYEEMLREWHLSDPSYEWERDMNSLTEDVQGNKILLLIIRRW
jgi:deoxyribonuclease-1